MGNQLTGTLTRQQIADRQAADTRILQKVNSANREAFLIKYPGQVEHSLRLVMERLQMGLVKSDSTDPGDPSTWVMTAEEIQNLAHSAYLLDSIRRGL